MLAKIKRVSINVFSSIVGEKRIGIKAEENVYLYLFISVIGRCCGEIVSCVVSFVFVSELVQHFDGSVRTLLACTSDQLEEFEQMIAANGGRVEHRAKSTLLVFPDGTAEQFYDGAWLLETEALASTTGGYFPANACTAQLMSVYPSTYGFQNGDTVFYKADKLFVATFFDASVTKAQQFTQAVVMRGAFNVNVRESEGITDGVAVYSFYAETFDYAIEFNCVEGREATMTIMWIGAVD